MRKKEISANKASKVYKIPSSTLYKIARKEGIELAQPFNAVATTWSQVRQPPPSLCPLTPDLPCPGRPEHRAGGHQGRHGRAEGRHRVRDPERDAVRPLQEGRDRAQQEHAGGAGPSTDIVILIGTSTVTIHYADLGSLVQVHICRFTGPRTT